MRNFTHIALSVGVLFALAGCTPALSDEQACEEGRSYAGEASSTVRNMTDNLKNPSSLAVYSNRLVEIADEAEALKIADDVILEALLDWSGSVREIGVFFSSGYEYGDDVDSIIPAFDSFEIANNKLIRLCDS